MNLFREIKPGILAPYYSTEESATIFIQVHNFAKTETSPESAWTRKNPQNHNQTENTAHKKGVRQRTFET